MTEGTPPTPYYEDDSVTLYHGDCREILPGLSADVLVTDPPYGVGMTGFSDELADAIEGVNLSPGHRGAIFMSPRTALTFAPAIDSWSVGRLLWMHKTADMAAPWRGWCMNSEAILIVSRRSESKWPTPIDYRSDVYTVGPWERAGHPAGKPAAVVADLIRRLSHTSEVIIDPFAGSGTTLRAAKDEGRRAIGVEIDERYCEVIAKRLTQDTLFGGVA